MVEWNIEYRFMIDMINSSIESYDFEGLAEWFNNLEEGSKHEFRTYCKEHELYYYDFARVVSEFYKQNPDINLAPNHQRRLVNWLFERAWNCDIVTVRESPMIADLIGLILFYKIVKTNSKEKQDVYLTQYVSILEPLLTNYIKYKMYDEAWDLAADCYFKIAKKGEKFNPWKKIFIRRLAEIGKLRMKYELELTPEMKELASQGTIIFSPTWYNLLVWEVWQKL